jgi:hypothetical protein
MCNAPYCSRQRREPVPLAKADDFARKAFTIKDEG